MEFGSPKEHTRPYPLIDPINCTVASILCNHIKLPQNVRIEVLSNSILIQLYIHPSTHYIDHCMHRIEFGEKSSGHIPVPWPGVSVAVSGRRLFCREVRDWKL